MTNAGDMPKECCRIPSSEIEQPICECGCECSNQNNPNESKPSCC